MSEQKQPSAKLRSPLSDERGYTVGLFSQLVSGFEQDLPPWRRWMKKSNGRFIHGKQVIVRPMRGVHPKVKRLQGKA